MTSVALHPVPTLRAVAMEQVHAVRLVLRKERIIFLTILGVASAIIIGLAVRYRHGITVSWDDALDGGSGIPMILGVIIAFGTWRADGPSQRTYHWTMPIPPVRHTLLKVMAGWFWLMAAVAVCQSCWVCLTGVLVLIGDARSHVGPVTAWYWWVMLIPFTAATVAYLCTSVVVVGTDHPWRWIAGVLAAYVALVVVSEVSRRPEIRTLLDSAIVKSPYSLSAALSCRFTPPDTASVTGVQHTTPLPGQVVRQWMMAVILWTGLGVLGVSLAAVRREES